MPVLICVVWLLLVLCVLLHIVLSCMAACLVITIVSKMWIYIAHNR